MTHHFRPHRTDRRKCNLTAETVLLMRAILIHEYDRTAAQLAEFRRTTMNGMKTDDPVYPFCFQQTKRYEVRMQLLKDLALNLGAAKFDTDEMGDCFNRAASTVDPATLINRKGK